MSVSIYVEQSERKRAMLPCDCVSYGSIDSGCYVCKGLGICEQTVFDVEPLNMSNANAASVFSLIGIHGEDVYYGSVEADKVADLRRRIFMALNRQDEIASAVRPTHIEYTTRVVTDDDGLSRIDRAPRLFSMGNNEEYLVRRLRDIDELLQKAQEKNCGIYWG